MEEKVSRTHDINRAINKQMEVSKKIKIGGAGLTGQDHIAVGIDKEIELIVEGEAGDFFGALNSKGILNLSGNVGRFLGDSMTGGGVIITGTADYGVGSYMTGGIVVVRGHCGDNLGQMKRGGVIIVDGNIGDSGGYLKSGGEIIITGNAGKGLGKNMFGGVIYIGGDYASIGKNIRVRELELADINLLDTYFSHYGITQKSTTFKKLVPATGGAKEPEDENSKVVIA